MILGFMLSKLSFAQMLHDIWMKIATSYVQKGWKFPTFVTNHLPYPTLPHSYLPTPRVSVPLCRDWCCWFFCLGFAKQGK
jgi:hypothetical protein